MLWNQRYTCMFITTTKLEVKVDIMIKKIEGSDVKIGEQSLLCIKIYCT